MYTFEQVLSLMEGSYDKVCCRKRVGYYHSFAIDFGPKIYHNQKRNVDLFYGEWQFRTYNRMWKILKDGQLILEGQNNTCSNDDLDDELQRIEFGRLMNILINNDNGLVLELDNGLSIGFISDQKEEEVCTIFLPKNRCLVFNNDLSWEYGRGDLGWPNYLELDYEE
ncbi:hypothetical protein [Psychrobacter sp. DM4]|uniref:hypothetical protein n=1 Tax=Psychrobacter sp. DM4 TaxID=3440637 RepID=UPI003F4FC5D8